EHAGGAMGLACAPLDGGRGGVLPAQPRRMDGGAAASHGGHGARLPPGGPAVRRAALAGRGAPRRDAGGIVPERGAGGDRLAASGSAAAGGACDRADRGTSGSVAAARAGAYSAARLPGESRSERDRGAAVLPSGGVVGEPRDPHRAGTL